MDGSSDDGNDHENVNYNDDDDNDDDDDDNVDDNRFDDALNLPIIITHNLEDCAFVGRMSKHIFRREQTVDNMRHRFCLEEELTFMITRYLTPLLKEILSRDNYGNQYFIWIAIETLYEKPLEEDTKISRWTSLRNRLVCNCNEEGFVY